MTNSWTEHHADTASIRSKRSPRRTRKFFSLLLIASLSICLTCSSNNSIGRAHAVPTRRRLPPTSCAPHTVPTRPTLTKPKVDTAAAILTKAVFKRATLPEDPIYALVKRLLPVQYHDHFVFSLKPDLVPASSTNIHDTFRISNGSDGVSVVIEGATLSGLGAGLNYYIRNICQVEMSWSGDRFSDMPTVPPVIDTAKGIIRASFVPWRYYMNVVTFGYSFVFWDWTRWERELDWMFLNGINMALAMVGQEYVFRQMYENLGLTREELNGFFAGPAYMPWQRMGNIQGSWGFPNDTQYKNDWIDSQWELQGHIMGRMDDFNITAVLPSFNGFVPRELTKKFPDVKFQNASDWNSIGDTFSRVTFVASTEPLFANLTQQFLQTQSALYVQQGLSYKGNKNYYLLDLYNELHPVCMEIECLKQITSGVMGALKSADPNAVWTMQSWFLLNRDLWHEQEIKAFFDGIRTVNDGRDAFVIDLYSDVAPLWNVTQGFFGIDWGWSMLNNFGGGQALYGTLPTLLTEPFKGYQEPAKAMRGMGITMEGINNNEYLYQLILDIPWESVEATYPSTTNDNIKPAGQELSQPPLDGQKHLEAYLKRRYGPNQTSDAVLEAWTTLSQTVWDIRNGQMSQSKSRLDVTPSLDMDYGGFMSSLVWYNQTKVVQSWGQLVQSTETVESMRRRGPGVIQNSIEQVLRITSGMLIKEAPRIEKRAFVSTPTASFTSRIRGSQQKSGRPDRGSSYQIMASWLTLLNSDDPQSYTYRPTNLKSTALPKLSDLPLNVSSFQYDLVDVTREIMAAVVLPGLHHELVDAYRSKDLELTRSWGKLVLEAILDTDRILATHSHFMLGPWIRDARISARVVDSTVPTYTRNRTLDDMNLYADYLEQQARTQVTWWGPNGQTSLSNYASKEWAGIAKEFYYPRWRIFIDYLVQALENGIELDYRAYAAASLQEEAKWQAQRTCLGNGCFPGGPSKESMGDRVTFPVEAVEDTAEVAQDLWDQWHQLAMRLAQKAEKEKQIK